MTKNNLYVFNHLGDQYIDDASAAIVAHDYEGAINIYGTLDWDKPCDVFIIELPLLWGTIIIPNGFDDVSIDVISILMNKPTRNMTHWKKVTE